MDYNLELRFAGVGLEDAVEGALDALYDVLAETFSPDDLEKAIPTLHPSQTALRTRAGRFTTYHPGRVNPRDALGRFRNRLTLAERQQAAVDAGDYINKQLAPRLLRHLRDYQGGHIVSAEWFDRCAEDIRLFYDLTYRQGKRAVGDPAVKLSPQDRAVLRRVVNDELHYLEGFRDHLDAGKGRMPYHERILLYAHAAMETFWMGWTLGDQRKGREIRWRLGPTHESCHDCVRFEAMGWLAAIVFVKRILGEGYAPQSGKLECQGHHCFLPGTRVEGVFDAAMRSLYRGQVVELVTRRGRRLLVTPHHPIATPQGFVGAATLNEGDQVFSYAAKSFVSPRVSVLGEDRVNDGPTEIEKVFDAFRGVSEPEVFSCAAGDFHGDGAGREGKVEIVSAHRKLPHGFEPSRYEERLETILRPVDMALSLKTGERDTRLHSVSDRTATSGDVGGGHELLPLFEGGAGVPGVLRFGFAAQLDASLAKPAGQDSACDGRFLRELQHRFPGVVALDEIIQVRHFDWAGHVYNLQSPYGWIMAEGIVSSNCKCELEDKVNGVTQPVFVPEITQ